MKLLKLYFNKLIYFFYRIVFKLLEYVFILKLIILFNNFLRFLEILIYEISLDLEQLYINYNKLKISLKKLGIIKNLLLIFLLILGILPVILFIYVLFYFFKYFFKYLFFILDFFISEDNSLYLLIKNYLDLFFEIIPKFILKIYFFLFRSNWTAYFIKLIVEYLRKKKNKLVNYILKKIDYFVLIYLPEKFYNFKDKAEGEYKLFIILLYYKCKKRILITYPWYIKIFFSRLYKIPYNYIYWKIYPKYLKYYLRNHYRYKLLNLKWDRVYWILYYFIRYRYIKIKFTSIWFFKLFIWTTAFPMTLEAFYLLNMSRFRSYFFYIFKHIYYNITYTVISRLYIFISNLFKIDVHFYMFLFHIKCWLYMKIQDIYDKRFYALLSIAYHFFIWSYIVILKTYFWIDFQQEIYFMEFGDRSQSWWNLQLYAIVIRFFTKAHVTRPGTFWHTLKWQKIIWKIRYYYWYFGNFKLKFKDISYFVWHHWILRKPQNKKIPDVEPNILQYLRR